MLTAHALMSQIVRARNMFDEIFDRTTTSYNAMIMAYAKNGYNFQEAYELFAKMLARKSCKARGLFDMMLEKNVITWTTMIDGYVKEGSFKDGFGLFSSMRRGVVAVNSITLTVMFEACGYVHNDEIEKAYRLFEIMPLKNLVYWTTMNAGFSNKGNIQKSVQFRMMPEKDEFSWTAIISAQHRSELEPDNAAPYVVLSNLYSIVGKKMDADQVTMTKKLKQARKSPGCSWIVKISDSA
ncbi:hypothetical protein JRO89_XS04G0079000 [Xanthoceras sorbifolium]|uniref:Pentatricopeptide repeat-containing protein n=1 Tax=Xanthoceras sorbifolium TaxID=99658 RepID=A0ABQ8I540_9ROSI|nr:hypothetical protein JRO89_XS04G0079000 [Xanthoceras sorbifolium]